MAISFSYDNVLPKPGLAILKNHTKSRRVALAVVNLVTVSRLVTVPMAIWGFWPNYVAGDFKAAIAWLVAAVVIAALTDIYDGILARELKGGMSEFGATLDPAMDKAFATAYFVLLIMAIHRALGQWNHWLIYTMGTDLTLVLLAIVGKKLLGDREISNKARLSGKIKFHFQVVAVLVGFVLFAGAHHHSQLLRANMVTSWLAAAACLFGTVSLVQHVAGALTAKKKAIV